MGLVTCNFTKPGYSRTAAGSSPARTAYLPRQDGCHGPRGQTNHQSPGLGAHVAGFERFADGIVPLEGYCQDGQDARMGHCQLHEGHRFTWKQREDALYNQFSH